MVVTIRCHRKLCGGGGVEFRQTLVIWGVSLDTQVGSG